MEICRMDSSHTDKVTELSKVFYSSDALDHTVPMDIIYRNIKTAVSGDGALTGYVFCEDGDIAGFSYVTSYYETEVGGTCVQILDLYVDEKYRGRGFASQYFKFVFDKYSYARRFRLEFVKSNENAVKLYRRIGFKDIAYGQMSIDKI